MKKLALISSYCDTFQKLQVLSKNIKTVKELGLDVLLQSPIPLPVSITEQADHYFQTSKNPVLKWPVKAIGAWKTVYNNGKPYIIHTTIPDHGWAGLFQTKALSEIGALLDYDRFYHMIYDLKIEETVINGLLSADTKLIYPYKKMNTAWPVALHFMVFDKFNLKEFSKHITIESYLSDYRDDAFSWLQKIRQVFNYDVCDTPVEDEIDYYNNLDIYNYSEVPSFKFFISKNERDLGTVCLLFYECEPNQIIKVFLNEQLAFEGDPSSAGPIVLKVNASYQTKIELEHNNCKYDISSKIKTIEYNEIETLN